MMLRCEQVSYNGEWVMTSPDGASVTLHAREEIGPPGFCSPGWRTASTTRRWRYSFRDEAGRVLYRGFVEDLTVVNTSTGREFSTVSFELDYCGDDRFARSFSATGTESDRSAAVAALRTAALHHHLSRSRPAPDSSD
jgi:hypothetical protein